MLQGHTGLGATRRFSPRRPAPRHRLRGCHAPPLGRGGRASLSPCSTATPARSSAVAVFSPDGSLLVSASVDGTVRIWDMEPGRAQRRSPRPRRATSTTSPSAPTARGRLRPPGTARCASGTRRAAGRRAALHSPTEDRPHGRRGVLPSRRQAARLANGDGHLRVWDVASGRSCGHCASPPAIGGSTRGRPLTPRGRCWRRAATTGRIRLWGAEGDDPVATLAGHERHRRRRGLPPGRRPARLRGVDGTVRLWDVATRKPVAVLRGHTGDRLPGRLQCRRPAARLGFRGQDGAPLGRRDRRGAGGAATRAASSTASPSTPTARAWPPAAPTTPSACSTSPRAGARPRWPSCAATTTTSTPSLGAPTARG